MFVSWRFGYRSVRKNQT